MSDTTSGLRPFADLIQAVVKLAEENPDKTAGDEYFHGNGRPCCIFGHAFAQFGLKAKQVQSACREDDYSIGEVDLYELGIGSSNLAQRVWATKVQFAQDDGNTWSEALAAAGPVPA